MPPRNLVVLHMESLSVPALQRGARFPEFTRMASEGTALRRFISSASSSLMAVSDFMAGNSGEMDHIVNFDDPNNRQRGLNPNLFDVLRDAGYRVSGNGYPVISRDDPGDWRLWGEAERPFAWHETYDGFAAALDRELSRAPDGSPFAMYVWDLRSHLSYSDADKPASMTGFQRIAAGHACIDQTVGVVRQLLLDRGLDEDTLVVAFGDHGDQFWSRGSYYGFVHGFEPYTELVWTPAFLWGAGVAQEELDDLVSLVDLAPTILGLLGIQVSRSAAPNPGIDVTRERRAFAFSQNLFTNQMPNKALPKSFSVTSDSGWHLVMAEEGLELFQYELDPTNQMNLLAWFTLDEGGVLRFDAGVTTHSHFRNTMNQPQVQEIQARFHELRAALAELLIQKAAACTDHAFDPSALLRIRPRSYSFNRDHRALFDADANAAELRRFVARSGPYASVFSSNAD